MKTLKQTIDSCNFDWVNSNIVNNFSHDIVRVGDRKLFSFEKYISSDDVIEAMKKEGFVPANISELLEYAKKGWNGTDVVVALGSTARMVGVVRVPCLNGCDAERGLGLRWWDVVWPPDWRLLGVRTLSVEPQKTDLSDLESLTLDQAIQIVKSAGYQISKII